MVATIWKILSKSSPGTSTTFAADDWDMIGRYMNDFDFTATAPSSIKTNTRYWDNRLRVWNPAKTFSYNIRSLALTANRDVTLPLLTSNDELVMLLHTQTIQNKVMNLANNTFTSTGATTGGIPKHDGTKYVNMARGSAGQVPTVNVGGTDWTWADPSALNVPDNAVSTTKIVDGAVTNAKLAGSITGDKILDGAVTEAKIGEISDKTKLPDELFYFNPQRRNVGWLNTSHESAHNGTFNGVCVATGTFSRILGVSGILSKYTTGAVSGNQAGFRTNVTLTRRNQNFNLKGGFSIGSTTAMKMFIGLVDDTGAFRSGSNPLNVKTGIGILVDTSLSTNFRAVRNDGAGSGVDADLGTPVALNTSGHSFEIQANEAAARIDMTFDAQTWNIATDIPAATTTMALQAFVETNTAGAKDFNLGYLILDAPATTG